MPRLSATDWAVVSACAAVVAAMAIFIGYFAVNLPFYEEWVHAGIILKWQAGTLSFAEFWADYNQGRNAMHRLFALTLWWTGLTDLRWQMATSLLLATTTAALLARIAWQTLPRREAGLLAFITFFLLLSPAQWQNFLWANQHLCFVPAAGLVVMITLVRSNLPPRICIPLCMLVALFATFTFTNGMLLWPLGVATFLTRPALRTRTWLSLWCIISVFVIGAYLHGLSKPEKSESASIPTIVTHFAAQFGAPFWEPLPLQTASHMPIVFWIGLAVLASLAVVVATTWRRWADAAVTPWLLITIYSLINAALLSWGRSQQGIFTATMPRYTTFVLPACAGLIGLLLAARRPKAAATVAIAFVAATLIQLPGTFERSAYFRDRVRLGQVQVLFAATAPEATQSNMIIPRNERLLADTRQHMIELSRIGFLNPGVLEDGNIAHLQRLNAPAGTLQIIEGRARGRVESELFDAVVITVRLAPETEIGVGIAQLLPTSKGREFSYVLPPELAARSDRISAFAVKASTKTAARLTQ